MPPRWLFAGLLMNAWHLDAIGLATILRNRVLRALGLAALALGFVLLLAPGGRGLPLFAAAPLPALALTLSVWIGANWSWRATASDRA